jgi:hypothetical protein
MSEYFNNSELALASYFTLSEDELVDQIEELKNLGDGMSEAEAIKFAGRYADVVVAQPNTTSGFSATVFREAGTNQLTVAFRGTEGVNGNDLHADNHITQYGAAYNQIVDMYNWWMRVSKIGVRVTFPSEKLV